MKKNVSIKKKVLIVILIIILVGGIVIKSNLNHKNNPKQENVLLKEEKENKPIIKPVEKPYSLQTKTFNLNHHLKKYKNEAISIDIDYIDNNLVYGSILNTKDDSILFTTLYLFQYNIKTDEYKEFKYNKGRIFDYYIIENNIYYISEKIENDIYHWQLIKSDLSFETHQQLDSGTIKNDMNSPRILYDNKDNELYIVTIKNEENSQFSNFYKVKNERLELLETFKENHDTKKGQFIDNMLYVTLHNGKIYYIKVEDYEKNEIMEYDVKKKNNKTIKEDLIENYYQEFYVTDLGLFINSKSRGKINNYFKKLESEEWVQLENYNKEFYFGRKLNNHTLTFIDGEQWFMLDTNNLQMFAGPKYKEQYPNYYVLEENQVLYQDFNENWVIGTFSEKN